MIIISSLGHYNIANENGRKFLSKISAPYQSHQIYTGKRAITPYKFDKHVRLRRLHHDTRRMLLLDGWIGNIYIYIFKLFLCVIGYRYLSEFHPRFLIFITLCNYIM